MSKSLQVVFTSAFLLASQSSFASGFLPPIDGKGVDPKFLESTRKDYCHNIEEENAIIKRLNGLAKYNADRLKKGSYAVYEVKVQQKDKKTNKVTREENWKERWEVVSLKDGMAEVNVTSNEIGSRSESFKNMPLFFAHDMDPKQPLTCLYWKIFAEKRKVSHFTINGKRLPSFERTQAALGNVIPEFTYAEGVPFNKATYKEVAIYEATETVKTHKIVDYYF